MVEAGHVVEGAGQPALDLVDLRHPRLGVRRQVVAPGSEPRLEQLHQQPGDVDVDPERVLDVVLRERRAALAHVLRVGAQHGRLPPGQPGAEHQRVEPVDLVVAVPHRVQRVLEELARPGRQRPAVAQPELVDVRRSRQALELVRPLVDDLDAHRAEHRQHLAQRQRRADPEDLEPGLATAGVHLLVHRQVDAVVALDRLEAAEVDRGGACREVLLVGLGERLAVGPAQARAGLLAVLRGHRGGEVVVPGAGRVDEAALEVDARRPRPSARPSAGAPRSAAGPCWTR